MLLCIYLGQGAMQVRIVAGNGELFHKTSKDTSYVAPSIFVTVAVEESESLVHLQGSFQE
jgi:hypothetical protein